MADSSHVAATTTKKSNKIRDIVRLQQMLKKWKKAATASSTVTNCNATTTTKALNNAAAIKATTTAKALNNAAAPKATTTTKGLNKFLKKTLSFSDLSSSMSHQEDVVRKGYLAVWVGREEDEMKKFVIPTDYLTHKAFSVLLRDAEEEFGFQQEGILKIPCDVPLFEKILKMMSADHHHNNNNKKQQQQQQHPILKSSSSTSSFFLYEHEQNDHHHQPTASGSPAHQLKTPPATPTHHLPLYCR